MRHATTREIVHVPKRKPLVLATIAVNKGNFSRTRLLTPELRAYYGLYTAREASTVTALRSALHDPRHSHDILSLDLARPAQVREVAAAINARVASGEIPPIRALKLNAGYQEFTTQTWTEDGFDMSFATNYRGH